MYLMITSFCRLIRSVLTSGNIAFKLLTQRQQSEVYDVKQHEVESVESWRSHGSFNINIPIH